MTTTMSCKYSIYRIFSDCFYISKTVDISMAGAFIVGIYPTISREILIDALIVMLNPVQIEMFCVLLHTRALNLYVFVARNLHCFVAVVCGC